MSQTTFTDNLVSIVIPYFNCYKYIEECLNSVFTQTHSAIQIIIVNDGSDEKNTQFLQSFLKEYPSITYLYQENKGVASARNAGAKYAKGEFLLFLDADDKLAPTYIEKAINYLKHNPFHKAVYSRVALFDGDTGEWQLPEYSDFRDLLISNRIPAMMALHKTEHHKEIGGFDENLKTHEDWEYWIRLLVDTVPAKKLDEILFYYRKRKDNSSLTDHLQNNPIAQRQIWQSVYDKHRELFFRYAVSQCDLSINYSESQSKLAKIDDKNHQLKQENQALKFREKKYQQLSIANNAELSVISGHSDYFSDKLKALYKTPSYQIIRTFKKIGWMVRGKPKKPYFIPNNEKDCQKEILKIMWSPTWSLLAPIHAIYALFKRKP